MSSEYPGKNRIIVGKNNCRSSSAKSLRSKIRGSVPRRDWTTTAMCPKQGLGSCQKYIQARRETTRLHSSHPQRSGLSQVPHQESRVGESLWLMPERVCIWSVRKTLTRLDTKESDDGNDGQQRGANESRGDEKGQTIGLIRQSYASSRNSRSAFIGETLRWTCVYVSLEKRSESTSHQEWQEN